MNYSPEEIAAILFNENPKDTKHYDFVLNNTTDEQLDSSYIFEILVQILFEGFDILTEGLSNVNIDNLTKGSIEHLGPWFNSFGFRIHVEEYSMPIKIDNYYCTSIINNELYKQFFTSKNINKSFHFMLNQKFANGCDIGELSKLFTVIYGTTKAFKIWFDFI